MILLISSTANRTHLRAGARLTAEDAHKLTVQVVVATMCLAVSAATSPVMADQSKTAKQDLPHTIVISLDKQRLTVFEGTNPVAHSRISSGKRGHRTPKGVFSILQKRRRHYSNLYHGAAMPYMQRLTWSGIALHAGALPGYPASHGCIRLPYGFAKKLFGMTEMAGRVIVTDGLPSPSLIAHQNLLKPLPPGDAEAAEANAQPRDRASARRWLMGIGKAEAATVNGDLQAIHKGPMTRAAISHSRRQHLQHLTMLAKDSREWAKDASDKLKEANTSLLELSRQPNLLKAERRELAGRVAEANSRKVAVEREMRDFYLRTQVQGEPAQADGLVPPKPRPASLQRVAVVDRTNAARGTMTDVPPPAPGARNIEQLETELEHRLLIEIRKLDRLQGELAALDRRIAGHDETIAAAQTRRDILKKRYVTAIEHSKLVRASLEKAERAQERYEEPVTVLVSRTKQKLYVRQDHETILEADVTITDPEAPIGTHVLTAMAWNGDQTELTWKNVTAARHTPLIKRPSGMSRKEYRQYAYEQRQKLSRGQTVEEALDRIEISPPVRMRIAELLKPGSTMMIHDKGPSLETGKYTDLIVEF